ncbi:MAG: electron transfer flavoprotein subunit alpha/FixB family protein [Acidobacteriia bacterium]|nr:electron transfer flavoprotein subunit alpha/FixB family protein [Terriglobia bacterium]
MPDGILVFIEQRDGKMNRSSWEALVAGQELGRGLGLKVYAGVFGNGVSQIAEAVAEKKLDQVYTVEHPLLESYTPDGYALAFQQVIQQVAPKFVLMSHTYEVRDFAPKLAASMGRALVGDVTAYRPEDGQVIFIRQVFQGKMNADVKIEHDPPYFVSFQAGAFRGDSVEAGESRAAVKPLTVALDPTQIRTKSLEVFREAKQAVDLSQAEKIVAIGRGIKKVENIEMARALAEALGAELAASRPICDSGWLPMDRQVGSSGQTVSPKLYLAIGISGATQHLVGMKSSRTIVAINKDPDAPIFEVADFGIVADLFEIIPVLTEAVKAARS